MEGLDPGVGWEQSVLLLMHFQPQRAGDTGSSFGNDFPNTDARGLGLGNLGQGMEEDWSAGKIFRNFAGRIETVHQRHGEIEDNQVGTNFLSLTDGFGAVDGGEADFEARIARESFAMPSMCRDGHRQSVFGAAFGDSASAKT